MSDWFDNAEKNGWSNAAFAVALLDGSYTSNRPIKSNPSASSDGLILNKLLGVLHLW